VRRFLARGLRLGVAGAALGLLAALAVTGLLRTVLFGVSPTDPAAFVQGLGVVLGAVALATLVPAWRASRTDPLQALRHQ
jgi:putative ABC transport system permease protein